MKHLDSTLQTTRILASLFALGILISNIQCGAGAAAGAANVSSSSNATTTDTNSDASTNAGLSKTPVPIPISLTDGTSIGLGLVTNGLDTPDSFVISLQNCSSGLTGNNSNATSINVYLEDTNCLGELTSFVLHGQSYVPTGTGSSPFTTWLAGNKAVFVGSGPTDLVSVIVASQVSSPIVNTDAIAYVFNIIKSSGSTTLTPTPQAIPLAVAGEDAPNFVIHNGDGTFNGLVTSGLLIGAGIFSFKMTCATSAMTVGANPSFNSFCPSSSPGGTLAGGASGVDVGNTNNFSYKLISDINSNGTLTLAQAVSTFNAGGDSNITLATDILSGSTGFQITNIDGPGVITGGNLILVLQAKNPLHPTNPSFSSFEYFPITLTPIIP